MKPQIDFDSRMLQNTEFVCISAFLQSSVNVSDGRENV